MQTTQHKKKTLISAQAGLPGWGQWTLLGVVDLACVRSDTSGLVLGRRWGPENTEFKHNICVILPSRLYSNTYLCGLRLRRNRVGLDRPGIRVA